MTSFESLAPTGESIPWPKLEKAIAECNMILISNIDITPPQHQVLKKIVEFCNCHKKLVIHDFDDLYDQVPESNPFRHCTLPWDFMKETIALAHVLTVTGKELQTALSPHHPRICILPNMVDCSVYLPRPRKKERLRIGWAGGVTHLADLPLIAESIRTLQKKYHFEFIVFGMFADLVEITKNSKTIHKYLIQPEELPNGFHKAFVDFIRHMDGIRYQSQPAVPYHRFPQTLSSLDLDIGLCPLQDNLFNRCRSGIKFYQYAAVQTATIASNIYPYSEEPVVLVENNPQSWTNALEALIVDAELREKTTLLQYEYVLQNRNYERSGVAWEILYQKLIERVHS